MKLNEMLAGTGGQVCEIHGNAQFQRRITSVGIALGSHIEMIQNDAKNPIMLYVRNTTLALNRKDSEQIQVEVMKNAR